MASEAVFKYLTDTNRPYSCADVTINLHGAFPKSAIQKALDSLSESGRIKCKLYGKQKVYAAIQQQENNNNDSDGEDVETKIKDTTTALSQKQIILKKMELDLKVLTSTPTTTAAKILISDKNKNIEKINEKINNLKGSTNIISVDERKTIINKHDEMLKEYRKRKNICNNMIEAILESYPKSKKAFLDELCLETDEMVNFQLVI